MDRSALRVLYIEDNAVNATLVERILARLPFAHLLVAATAGEGLATARREPPDLVFLDLHLPDMSGEDVLRAIRAEAVMAATRVVVLTADAAKATESRVLALGADGVLTKPVQVVDVIDAVNEAARLKAAA